MSKKRKDYGYIYLIVILLIALVVLSFAGVFVSDISGEAYRGKKDKRASFADYLFHTSDNKLETINALKVFEICCDGKDNDDDKLIDIDDSDCSNGVCFGDKFYDVQKTKDNAKQFQAIVYKEEYGTKNGELILVGLNGLEGDGTLNADAIKVINYCQDGTSNTINSPNNIFIYNPITERLKFDQVSAYYYGYETIEFYKQFADLLGWTKQLSNGLTKLKVPILKIKLCDKSLGDLSDENTIVGGTFYDETMYVGYIDFSTFIHEYTHGRYIPIISKHNVKYGKVGKGGKVKPEGEWWHLNEAYASFIPRMYFSSNSIGEYGDLDNNYKYGKKYNECDCEDIIEEEQSCSDVQNKIKYCKISHNISAIGGALWDFSQEMNNDALSAELVISSWRFIHLFDDNNPAPTAARLALIKASKEKYGVSSNKHLKTRNMILDAFKNHGIMPVEIVTEI